jgi:hypothetical protein
MMTKPIGASGTPQTPPEDPTIGTPSRYGEVAKHNRISNPADAVHNVSYVSKDDSTGGNSAQPADTFPARKLQLEDASPPSTAPTTGEPPDPATINLVEAEKELEEAQAAWRAANPKYKTNWLSDDPAKWRLDNPIYAAGRRVEQAEIDLYFARKAQTPKGLSPAEKNAYKMDWKWRHFPPHNRLSNPRAYQQFKKVLEKSDSAWDSALAHTQEGSEDRFQYTRWKTEVHDTYWTGRD